MWIEIFKSGVHTDSSGNERSFSVEDISAIAEKYNQSVSSDNSCEAPVVIGHPKDNTPAYGWVERLARRGEILLAKLKNLAPELIEQVRQGAFRKVSVSLFPDLMLRHIGLLGGATPAVKGLKNIAFNDYDSPEFIFSLNPNGSSDFESVQRADLIEKINFLEQENQNISKILEEKDRIIQNLLKEAKIKELREFINSEVNSKNAFKLSPAQSENLLDILQLIYERGIKKQTSTDNLISEYSENEDLIAKIKNFIMSLSPNFNTDEFAVRPPRRERNDNLSFSGKKIQDERMSINNRALEIMNENPTLSYVEAVIEAQS